MANRIPLVTSVTEFINQLQTADELADNAGLRYVRGPASATDNAVALYDSTTGTLIKNSVVIVTGSIVTGITEINGGIVFNEPGADVDHRFEGDTATSLLVLDAGLDAVQIGTTVAGAIADFRASIIVINETGADQDLRIEGDTSTHLLVIDASNNSFNIGTNAPGNLLMMGTTATIFNDDGSDIDFRIEGDTATNLFVVDAGTDSVRIGTTVAGDLLDFNPTTIIFNDGGADRNIRMEGDTATFLLFLDAGLNSVAIGDTSAGTIADFSTTNIILNNGSFDCDIRFESNTLPFVFYSDGGTDNLVFVASGLPNFQSMTGGIFIENATAAPTGNPTSGTFVYGGTGDLNVRNTQGAVTMLSGITRGATASVADGGTITHNLGTTPTGVVATGTVAAEHIAVTAVGATTFTVAIKDTAGAAGTTQTIYWQAFK